MAGTFITLEGIDGCGKTTQAKLLTEAFRRTGAEVVALREPGGTQISEKIRALLLDRANAEKLKDLVLYESMNTPAGQYITLKEYVDAMPESQKDIYYITGDKREAVASSPALEYFRQKGYDVLFMTDPIDEWVMQSMYQYAQKYFKSVIKGDFEDKELEEKVKSAQEKYSAVSEALKKHLEDKVSEVRFSGRLTDSPCCLIVDGAALSPHMERLFRAMNQEIPVSKRILELNGDHPLISALNNKIAAGCADDEIKRYASILYDQALLLEGSPLTDPAAFAKEVVQLLENAIK
jgi:molecular chaperone HtpG